MDDRGRRGAARRSDGDATWFVASTWRGSDRPKLPGSFRAAYCKCMGPDRRYTDIDLRLFVKLRRHFRPMLS